MASIGKLGWDASRSQEVDQEELMALADRTVRPVDENGDNSHLFAPQDAAALKIHLLREVDIFCDLSPEEMAWLKDVTPMITRGPGCIVYGEGEESETLFILKAGRVQLYRLTPEGKKLEIATIDQGTFFGEMPLLGQRMRGTFAETATECLICVLTRADVERLIMRKPQVAIRMLHVLSHRLAEVERRIETLAFQRVPTRLASALPRMSDRDEVHLTHQELAEIIGAYRETVNQDTG